MSRENFEIEVLIELRKIGKPQKWLAEVLGISEPYLSDILRGNRKAEKKVAEIKQILGIKEKAGSKA